MDKPAFVKGSAGRGTLAQTVKIVFSVILVAALWLAAYSYIKSSSVTPEEGASTVKATTLGNINVIKK